jgi:dolichol-phosphate mannosyltransferase
MRTQTGGPGAGPRVGGSPPDDYHLSLVIPAFNEQETIRQAIREADDALAATAADYEIIVVDDGSTDRTADVARAEAASNPRVRLIRHLANRGYGAALRTGFQAAGKELVAFTDADCQFDLRELVYVLPLTGRFDIVCGYRIARQDSAPRRFCSWGYNTLVKVLIGSDVHDIDCALKVFRREPLQALLPECDNFFVNTEMLSKARRGGLSVVEVGVHHRPRAAGQSKVSILDVPRTLSALLPFWWSRVLFPARERPSSRFGLWSAAALLLLGLVAGLLLFLNLSYPLIKPDESRYAEISQEMLASGDWVVPTLNQEPYYDKPPLYYWLTVASFRLLGTNEMAARLVPAGAAWLTVLLTYLFARRVLGARAGFLAALVLTLMVGFVQCGRFVILDSVLTLFVTAALFMGHEGVRGPRLRWPWWLASALACALGVLTKGPVALVLLGPPVVAHAWLTRGPARPRLAHWLAYATLVLAVVGPWYLAILLRDPAFARHFFIEHHLHRFLGSEYHDSPVWFYVPVLVLGCLPWSLLMFPVARFLFGRSPKLGLLRAPSLGFFLLWAGWCVFFFSLSRGKLAPYILPAMPAVAVILGSYLARGLSQTSWIALREGDGRVPRRAVTVIAGAWLLVGAVGWWKGLIGTAEYLTEAAVCAACIVGLRLWGRKLPLTLAWGLCFVVVGWVIYEVTDEMVPAWAAQRSPLTDARELAPLLRAGDTAVAAYGHPWCSVPLELNRQDILNFSPEDPVKFMDYLKRHARVVLVTKSHVDEQRLRWAVPADRVIRRVMDAGETRVFLIQPCLGGATARRAGMTAD